MIDPTQAAGQPPATPPQADGAQPGAQPEVCIKPQGDGTFMVYTEGQEAQAQPAQDIDSALDAARQLLGGAAGGQQDPQAADAQAEALFKGGFSDVRGGGQG